MEIGKRIQRLRREKDLTQEQMAAALGVTSAAVSKWETGAAIPDVSMLCPLARMLGTTVDGLLDFRPALEQGEIDALLEDRRKLFEAQKIEEGVASCEALLREYPDDLRLKCAAAGLYVMYMPAILDTDGNKDSMKRVTALLEESRKSGDPLLASSSRSMLVSLYVMQEEPDRALEILDEEPEVRMNVRTARANILLRKGDLDEAEKLYQTGLWAAGREVSLNLAGLYNAAYRREDWTRALACADMALAVERTLGTGELGGLSSSLYMLRAEVLRRQGRPGEGQGGGASIRFADIGCGFWEASLPHLFEQFWREDQARSAQNGEGSGLGLYIVKHIVEAHGGTIQAENDGGLAFTIAIPRKEGGYGQAADC